MVGTTWRRAIAEEVARLYRPGQDFTLTDFYRRAEDRLQEMWPDNTTVRATIRRELQMLRDAGLVSFHGRGRYTYRGPLTANEPQEPKREPLAAAAYELAARLTAETRLPAVDHLAVARAKAPETALRELVLAGRAGTTFAKLHEAGRLDLSIERMILERASDLSLPNDLVSAAAGRLAYYESDAT